MRWLFPLLALALMGQGAGAAEVPVVAAASDLHFALTEIAERFARETGRRVKLSFGSSGNFFRQIAQGGPYEIYFSADETYVLRLAQAGRTVDEGRVYAVGRIALFVPRGSPLKADGRLEDLARSMEDGRLKKFAIANPAHAPYGRAARAALAHAGLWEKIQPYLVLGENVSQAAQFAASQSTQGGIIAYSLALAPQVSARGTFALIPEEWHPPLAQRMALVRGAGDTARRFYDYVQSPGGREILKRYGFIAPEGGD